MIALISLHNSPTPAASDAKKTSTDPVDTTESEQVAERVAPMFARPATVVTIDNEACTHQVCVYHILP